METTAVYWESKIKTFGFEVKTNRCLLDWRCPLSYPQNHSFSLSGGGPSDISFDLVYGSRLKDDGLKLSFVFPEHQLSLVTRALFTCNDRGREKRTTDSRRVDLICFLGPHFNDRYGIADFTFKAIEKGGIVTWAVLFSGSSVFLVLPQNTGCEVKRFFSDQFFVPEIQSRSKGVGPILDIKKN